MAIVNERMNPPVSNPDPKTNRSNAVTNAQTSSVNSFLNEPNQGFFGSIFPGNKKKKSMEVEPPPAQLKVSGTLSEREYMETEVIKLLIMSYFNIVKRTVCDMVPKAAMLKLVNHTREELQRELLQELYRSDVFGQLLKESEATMERRKECKRMIQALQKADEIVSSV